MVVDVTLFFVISPFIPAGHDSIVKVNSVTLHVFVFAFVVSCS